MFFDWNFIAVKTQKETAKMGSSSSSSSSKQTVEPVNVDEPALHFVQANAAAVDLISFELVDASSGQLIGQSLDDKHSLGEIISQILCWASQADASESRTCRVIYIKHFFDVVQVLPRHLSFWRRELMWIYWLNDTQTICSELYTITTMNKTLSLYTSLLADI